MRITVFNPFADVHQSFLQVLGGSNDSQSLYQKMHCWSGFARHHVFGKTTAEALLTRCAALFATFDE